jgi:hypothetical protein
VSVTTRTVADRFIENIPSSKIDSGARGLSSS